MSSQSEKFPGVVLINQKALRLIHERASKERRSKANALAVTVLEHLQQVEDSGKSTAGQRENQGQVYPAQERA